MSKDIIAAYEHTWPAELTVQAKFYNHFYQGHLELAVLEAKKSTYFLPASSVYWQALSYAEDKLFEIIKNDLEANVMNLRTELFETRDQLHALKNSRVIGRAIKVRNKIGNPYTLPKRSANKARRTAAKFVPDAIRLPLMKNLRQTRNAVRQKVGRYREGAVVVTSIDNKSWEKGEPLVSVVIPYYNRADTVDETLQSLDRQTFRNFEVIVVDDKSNDKASIEKLNHLPGVTVIRHKTNEGVARARNNGIAAAKGKYILCLDSDDMVEETYIEKATMILETHPDIALVSAYQDAFGVINEVFEKHP